MKTINKTVVVNGISQKVAFATIQLTKNYLPSGMTAGQVVNDVEFSINGKSTIVTLHTRANKSGWQGYRISNSYELDGRNFGDSEKKVIEYILSK